LGATVPYSGFGVVRNPEKPTGWANVGSDGFMRIIRKAPDLTLNFLSGLSVLAIGRE
jgi:hypothetical protein